MYLKVQNNNRQMLYLIVIIFLISVILFLSLKILFFTPKNNEVLNRYKNTIIELKKKNYKLDSLNKSLITVKNKNQKIINDNLKKIKMLNAQLFYANISLDKNLKIIDSLYRMKTNKIKTDYEKVLKSNEIRYYIDTEFYNNK